MPFNPPKVTKTRRDARRALGLFREYCMAEVDARPELVEIYEVLCQAVTSFGDEAFPKSVQKSERRTIIVEMVLPKDATATKVADFIADSLRRVYRLDAKSCSVKPAKMHR